MIFGITNFGNSCYWNALFQALYSSATLVNAANKSSGNTTFIEILRANLQTPLYQQYAFKCAIKSGQQPGSQQDPDEAFKIILDEQPPEIQKLFEITVDETHKCECGFFVEKRVKQNYIHIIDGVNEKSLKYSLTTAKCDKCGAQKKVLYDVVRVSEILYVHMYAPNHMKFRELPKEITFEGRLRYELCAYVVHSGGSLHGGHYYSYVKRDEKYYLCDDASVRELPDFDQTAHQKYIAIYEYKNN